MTTVYIIAAFTAGVLVALAVLIVFSINKGSVSDDMMQDEYYGQDEKHIREIEDKKYRHLR